QAFAMADAEPVPEPQVQVAPPAPVAPVDAAGKPLTPDPQADSQVLGLAASAQILREQGTGLRERAALERANAATITGNMRMAEAGIAKAEAGVSKSEEHLAYRRDVVGKAKEALEISKQKADMVAAEAPNYSAKGEEGKAQSGPMAGEAKDLSAENASRVPDDVDAAAKSREQGDKMNKVGPDIGTMDDAITQTKSKADDLSKDCADAKQTNTQQR